MVKVSIGLSIMFGVATFVVLLVSHRKELNGHPIDSESLSFIAFSLFAGEFLAILAGAFWFVVIPIIIIVGGVLLFIYWDTFKQFWKEWRG